jgi:hypothetical protein
MAVTLSADEEAVIKKRLLTQTTVARLNADPPLKKVAKRCDGCRHSWAAYKACQRR